MSTIIIAVSGCFVTLSGSNKWYAAHMISTSLTSIFQESVYRILLLMPFINAEAGKEAEGEEVVGAKNDSKIEKQKSVAGAKKDSENQPKAPEVPPDNEFEKRIRPEVIPANEIGVTFADIGALDETKESLQELVMLPPSSMLLKEALPLHWSEFIPGKRTKSDLEVCFLFVLFPWLHFILYRLQVPGPLFPLNMSS